MRIDRRRLLGALGGGLAAPAAPAAAQGSAAFRHGVASGDPLADRAIIWSRLTVADGGPRKVEWQVARDAAFRQIVSSGEATAEAGRDHTIKIDVGGLDPGREHHYRFRSGAAASPVGRFRTLPTGPTAEVTLAAVSCQLYPGGLFNAYDALARLPKLDAVVHLGDYIYEYGAGADQYGMQAGVQLGRIPDPPHEIVTLADYRRRHAQYKSDPDLQAAHARAAFICVWDDHETANDSWTGGAENHQPEREGDWAARKAAALRAYYEWMPIREPAPGAPIEAISRRYDFGDLASLLMVETRLGARSRQLTYADLETRAGADGRGAPDVAGFRAKLQAPDREMLGPAQQRWLQRELADSRASGRPWQVIGNQVVMAEVLGPDAEQALGAQGAAALMARLEPDVRRQVEQSMTLFKLGLPFTLDSWDGYPAARERLYQAFAASGSRPLVLSGDSHAFWVNRLKAASGELAAIELGASSITSPSPGDSLKGFPLGEALTARNPQVAFCDQHAKGFILVTLRRNDALAELIAVSTIAAKPYETRVLGRWRISADLSVADPLARA